jgi:hypothetical protein
MTAIPDSLETAIAQAREATRAAIQAGLPRMTVELVYSELKGMPVAEQFPRCWGRRPGTARLGRTGVFGAWHWRN